jgi:hypothetical protein
MRIFHDFSGSNHFWARITVLAAVWLGVQVVAAAEDFFDTNKVLEVQIQIAPDDWKVLRYQHRESDLFPEEGVKPATNAYSWFPAKVTVDGRPLSGAKVRK